MATCISCQRSAVKLLLDCGSHPISNRFLQAPTDEEFLHPMVIGQCQDCGLVQMLDPVPASELMPKVDWITYNEPEGHLDQVAEMLSRLPGLPSGGVFVGISFKDDTLLARMERYGFRTRRLDLRKDLGIERKGCGVETVQANLTGEVVKRIQNESGQGDVVIARHILEHAHDLPQFIEYVRALAKPGGYVVYEVPDCTLALEKTDITTLWEEHIAYFTSASYRSTVTAGGCELARFHCYPYPFENCLVAVVRVGSEKPPEFPNKSTLERELNRATRFASEFPKKRKLLRASLERFRANRGKIALFGAGHLACTWVHLMGFRDLIEFVVDDNLHKLGLFLPGSHLPIRPSSALISEEVKLALLSLSPEAEPKVIARNAEFAANGGVFASIFPSSPCSFDHVS